MTVRPTNERYVYSVEGSSPGKWYRVDLTANEGAGRCACIDFGTRRQPQIDAGVEACTPATTCKHSRAAQIHFLREILRELSLIEEGKK